VGRWRVAAVARRRGAGRTATPTKTIGVAECLPTVLVLQRKGKWLDSIENFGSTSPAWRGSQNLQKTLARRPTTTCIPNIGTKAINHIHTTITTTNTKTMNNNYNYYCHYDLLTNTNTTN